MTKLSMSTNPILYKQVVNLLVKTFHHNKPCSQALRQGNRSRAFKLLITSYINEAKQSVEDLYVQDDARAMVGHALNIVNKQLKGI